MRTHFGIRSQKLVTFVIAAFVGLATPLPFTMASAQAREGHKRSLAGRVCEFLLNTSVNAVLKPVYEAVLKVEEAVGIPWTLPPSVDQEIRRASNSGDLRRATRALLQARLMTSSEASARRAVDRLSNPIVNPKVPRAIGFDPAFTRRVFVHPKFSQCLLADLAMPHEGRHLVGTAGCLGRMKGILDMAVKIFLPWGNLWLSPYSYFSERAAMGAEWELYSRMTPATRQRLLWELRPLLANRDTQIRQMANNISQKIQNAHLPKYQFLAFSARISGYGPVQLPVGLLRRNINSGFEWGKVAVTAGAVYLYPDEFYIFYSEVMEAIEQASQMLPW